MPEQQRFLDWTKIQGNTEFDRLPDYSFSGYKNNHVPIPQPKIIETIYPSNDSNDRTDDIQAAMDRIGKQGNFGVVLLKPGNYYLKAKCGLYFKYPGVVLRGESPGSTYLQVRNKNRPVITFGSKGRDAPSAYIRSDTRNITNPYVPVGAKSLNVDDSRPFSPGSTIIISHYATASYIQAMNMHNLTRDGKKQTWLPVDSEIQHIRTVLSVDTNTNTIYLDIPLVDSLDSRFCQAKVSLAKMPQDHSSVYDCGVENLDIVVAPSHSGDVLDPVKAFVGLLFSSFVQDCWALRVSITGFNSSVQVLKNASRLTLADVSIIRNAPTSTASAALPFDFELAGYQILLLRCSLRGNPDTKTHAVALQSRIMGPTAIVEFNAQQPNHVIATHQRWSNGLLVDNCKAGKIQITDRGNRGSGHGWTGGSCVVWNSQCSHSLTVSKPPLSQNYFIGCIGKTANAFDGKPDGAHFYHNNPVSPKSLFRAQLESRIGSEHAQNIIP